MTPLFKKLNFKNFKEIFIINHPDEFEVELVAMKNFTSVKTDISNTDDLAVILYRHNQKPQRKFANCCLNS